MLKYMKEKNVISTSKSIARKLKVLSKARNKIRHKLTVEGKKFVQQAENVVVGAKKNESARKALAVTAGKLAVIVKKKEGIRKNLVVKGKKLVVVARKKESARKKLVVVAKKKEIVRKELVVTTLAEEEAKAKDEAMLSSIREGLIAVDMHGRVMVMSKATERLLGLSFDELKGKIFNNFITVIDEKKQVVPKNKRPLYLALTTGKEIINTKYSYVRKDGTSFPASSITAPIILKGKIIGSINNFQDITEEKALAKAKDEFISLASHQLKSPTTAISWSLEALLDGDEGPLNDGQKKLADSAYASAKNMAELVSGFLDITKMESSGFAIESGDVNLLEISDSVLAELANQLAEKKITLVKEYGKNIPHLTIGTKTARVIFQNLLSNAVKYTPEGGTVEAKIEKTADGISISVKDNGYGIPNEAKSHIFTKLFRADNIKEKEPSGTGLGLYLLKSLVDKLGGKVWFESEEGQGTTFYVNLK